MKFLNKIKYSGKALLLFSVVFFVLIYLVYEYSKNISASNVSMEKSEFGNLVFSHKEGFYKDNFYLELQTDFDTEDYKILYTKDGSLPDINNINGNYYAIKNCIDCDIEFREFKTYIYDNPIKISDNTKAGNNFSDIPNSYIKFNEPKYNIDKAKVIRVSIFKDSELSEIITKTYFVGHNLNNYLNLPVMSLIIQEDDFWGYEKGIYVPGANFDTANLDYSGNHFQRGRDWERPVYVQFFEQNKDLAFSQLMGIRIHGGTSRKFANRSLRLYARSDYGESTINHNLFQRRGNQVHKRLKLRTAGQDNIHAYFRDALMCVLMLNRDAITEDYQPVNVFINGEYWGIFNLRERFDRHYVERNFGIPRDNVEIIDHWTKTTPNYRVFGEFVKNINPDNSFYYDIVNSMININSLIDIKIAEMFFGRWDIHWETWKEKNSKDSKWQWVLWDMDVGMGLPNVWGPEWSHNGRVDANYIEPFLTYYRHENLNKEFALMMQNNCFKNHFLNRFTELLNSTLTEDRIIQKIHKFKNQLEPAMPKHIERWSEVEGIESMEAWFESINVMISFAEKRHYYVYQQLIDYFSLRGTSNIKFFKTDNCCDVVINDSELDFLICETYGNNDNKLWSSAFFKDIPIKLSLSNLHCNKCSFKAWEVNGKHISNEKEIVFSPDADNYTIRAVFN